MGNISDLKFDDKNFNKHTQYGMGLLEKSLNQFGAGRSILVDKDNNIIAGNGIVEAAQNAGITKTKVIETDGTELVVVKRKDVALDSEEGRGMALADNATAAADLEWNDETLGEYFDDDYLRQWGVAVEKPYKEIVEDDPDPIDEENTYSVVGDIYKLGDHRIFCGSFEDDEKVRELFGNKKATCTFTDPPYNVAVESRTTGLTIQNDKMGEDDFQDFLNRAFECVAANMATGGGVISWMSDKEILALKQAFDFNHLNFKTVLCWVKSQFTLGGNDFQSAKELAIYGLNEGKQDSEDGDEAEDSQYACYARGKEGKFTDSRKLSNVWFFAKPKANKDHPTMKPIGLCAKGILAMSEPGDIVFDPFSGSGSTMIACEQTGRVCYGCEIDPKYCDVIRKRYWKFKTGSEEGWQEGTK